VGVRQIMSKIESDATRGVKPLQPIRLSDQVFEGIKELVRNGTLHPGDRVVEQKIASAFGVGQNAVREALIELAHWGFVRRIPNRGTYITKLTQADVEKISQVRLPLERLVIEVIAGRLAKEDLDFGFAAELLSNMETSFSSGDIASFYEYDIQFHRTLWQLAENDYLANLLEQIVVPLFAFSIIVSLDHSARIAWFQDAIGQHRRVIDALKARSLDEALEAIRELVVSSLKQQREMLGQMQTGQPESSSSRQPAGNGPGEPL
jgi:DNA-binding GntR family transcriptional regulator